jgi:hypothetical protein
MMEKDELNKTWKYVRIITFNVINISLPPFHSEQAYNNIRYNRSFSLPTKKN